MRKWFLAYLAVHAAAASPAVAAPVSAGAAAQVKVKIIRPLTLTSSGTLTFGTILLNGLTANRTVALSNANVLNCGGGTAELICSGVTSVPTYNVRGSNQQVVTVIKTASNLTNPANGSTLTLTPTGPATITIPNSGAPGINFTIGGTITITPTTGDGLYSGTVNIQVDYQ